MNNKAIFKISYGLFVLSVKDSDKANGCIVNTVMQVTSSPDRVSVAVSKENYTHDILMETKEFTASVISEKADFELFRHFGFQSGADCDKFADYSNYENASNEIPYIKKGCNSYICGKITDSMDLGTHTLFIADVTDMDIIDDAPSATYEYYHKNIKPAADTKNVTSKTSWLCTICGYIYDGDPLPADFICPICKHDASVFVKIDKDGNKTENPEQENDRGEQGVDA